MTNFKDLLQTVSQGENARVEFKSVISEEVLRGLSTDIAAFANSQGGVIVFGVTSQQEIVGCHWNDKDSERISQQSSNCTPAITIDFEEVRSDHRRCLLVHIPKSSIIHNDVHRKFPCRIGNMTGYLDALGLVALLQERGLTKGDESRQFQIPPPRTRDPISRSEEKVLVQGLKSKDPAVRLEALRDINTLAHFHTLLERKSLSDCLESILGSQNAEEIKLLLQALRTVVLRGTSREKARISPRMQKIVELGKKFSDIEIARTAFDILLHARHPGGLQLVMFWVKDSDDQTFATVQPQNNLLFDAGPYGLRGPLRKALYNLLSESPAPNIRTRASAMLNSLRQVYY